MEKLNAEESESMADLAAKMSQIIVMSSRAGDRLGLERLKKHEAVSRLIIWYLHYHKRPGLHENMTRDLLALLANILHEEDIEQWLQAMGINPAVSRFGEVVGGVQ